jgi:hypothetical protein
MYYLTSVATLGAKIAILGGLNKSSSTGSRIELSLSLGEENDCALISTLLCGVFLRKVIYMCKYEHKYTHTDMYKHIYIYMYIYLYVYIYLQSFERNH